MTFDTRAWIRKTRALVWLWMHRLQDPAMVRRVMFFEVTQASDGTQETTWGTLGAFGEEWFRLEYMESQECVVSWLKDHILLAQERELLVDRSFIRGLGAKKPSHPAGHRTFSVWVSTTPEEVTRARVAGGLERVVGIEPDAFWV